MKIFIDNKEIDYIVISETGRIVETGEKNLITEDGKTEPANTFSGTYVKLNSIRVGKPLTVCFNKDAKGSYLQSLKPLKFSSKDVKTVWVELNYNTLSYE